MGVPITYNIRNLVQRKGTTFMTALGIGLTVAVLIVSMAMTAGLKAVFAGSGDARQVLVMRKGVDAELSSTVSSDSYEIIRRMPGIAQDQSGEPMVSPEGVTVVNLPSVDSPEGMNVTVRGLLPIGLAMRSFTIVRGKMMTPGLRQIVVGESVAKRYPTAQLGKKVRFGRGMWEVVGVFKPSGRIGGQQRDLGGPESGSRRFRSARREQFIAHPNRRPDRPGSADESDR